MEEARFFAKCCSRLATTIAVVTAIGIPGLFYTFLHHTELSSLQAELEVTDTIITRAIRLNPIFWKYDLNTLKELLRSREGDDHDDNVYLLLPDGRTIVEHSLDIPGPFIGRSRSLTDAGEVVAELHMERSLRPLFTKTAIAFAIAISLATILFFLLKYLPFKIIKRAESSLRESSQFLKKVMEGSTNAIFVVDMDDRILMGNHRSTELSGYPLQDLQQISFKNLFNENDFAKLQPLTKKMLDNGQPFSQQEIRLLRPDGAQINVACGATPWTQENGIISTVWTLDDVTAYKLAEKKIRELVHYDPLTLLPNRTLLHIQLEQNLTRAEQDNCQTAILFLDLDHFKNINDSLGHRTGDLLLKEVAKRLQGCLRDSDMVARYGGDEFIIVFSPIPSNHLEHINLVAGRILQSVEAPIKIQGNELFTSCSIGISVFPLDGHDTQSLLKHADLAMHQAKEQGRKNFQRFSMELNQNIHERMQLETSLRQALPKNQLFLHYQPKLDLKKGQLSGIEVLARWRHPQIGLVRPDRFIPVAEETGLIHSIGNWILRTACQQHIRWQKAGLAPPPLAVNLSILQLQQQDFIAQISSVLKETGLPPDQLELELTESCLMKSTDEIINKLTVLRDLGVKIAIDDFGTGYSSLGYLKYFPVDKLKIDRCFINDISSSFSDSKLAQAIIAMAKSLGLQVIAEGVELEEQLNLLVKHNCDEIQGYLYSQPLSTLDMGAFMLKELSPADS